MITSLTTCARRVLFIFGITSFFLYFHKQIQNTQKFTYPQSALWDFMDKHGCTCSQFHRAYIDIGGGKYAWNHYQDTIVPIHEFGCPLNRSVAA